MIDYFTNFKSSGQVGVNTWTSAVHPLPLTWHAGLAGSELPPPLNAPVRAPPTTWPTAEPTATPAAVVAIWAMRPGPWG